MARAIAETLACAGWNASRPSYALPTITVPVRIALVGHDPGGAELFITEALPRGGRSALLDDGRRAARRADARSCRCAGSRDDVRLLAKRAIAWIAVQREQPSADGEFDNVPSEVVTLYDRQHHVLVELTTGKMLEGMLFDSAPADRPRVIDHLNGTGRFLRLWTSDEHYLINKDHILAVMEQE